MRPAVIAPLFAPARGLPGVGPRTEALLAKALDAPRGIGVPRVIDVLFHLPTGAVDRTLAPSLAAAVPGTVGTFRVRPLLHRPAPRGAKTPYRIACDDATGRIELVFFHADAKRIESLLPPGSERVVSGRVEGYRDALQMPHPDYVVDPAAGESIPALEPVYPLTAGLTGRTVGKAARAALERLPDPPEWQDAAWIAARGLPSFREALTSLHRPASMDPLAEDSPARARLAYDELLANQLALALVRRRQKAQRSRALIGDGRIRAKISAALPFALTPSQARALAEIEAEMASPERMSRLLQGDVGSGKTVVALMAMALAVEAGGQAALMAPTEVLARQHAETIAPLAEASGLRVACLTGREKGRARADILDRLAARDIDILIGTHALFQSGVAFADLAFAVIDEQHRFGVRERKALQGKGGEPIDVLAMTATPIPRTLLMTHYADLDASRLTEKPAGRKPVKTTASPLARIADVIEGLRRAVRHGAQVYWVCPLIETSEAVDLAAAEERFADLREAFGARAGLLHGAMAAAAKDAAMAAFAGGSLDILVATTVIEVGVNVPNATIMVIEHAERFGLAQLHQLRGRVGRGERQSYCILLYKPPLSAAAEARLDVMRETEDGFLIAEKDLELRGGGEVLGSRQSGMQEFRLANERLTAELLPVAHDDARLILATDPDLKTARGEALRTLLYLLEQDEAVRLFRAG